MLNSTKTWQEKFDEIDDYEFDTESQGLLTVRNTFKQFISDLRKRDMEALIEYLKESDSNNVYSLIRNYYE